MLNVLVGAALLMGGAGPTWSEEAALTPAEMRGAAYLSLRVGKPEQALMLAEALLSRDPSDIDAQILKSQALRDLGQYSGALDAAKSAYRLADTDEEIYSAAMVRAQALASSGARTRAQWWLRMAGQHAPDDATRNLAIRDFRYVRSRNPWNTKLSFSIAPTSNVNNGTTRDRISYGGLQGVEPAGVAKALSGLSFSGGLTTRYRILEGETHETEAGLHLFGQTYALSDDAKEEAPDAEGSDFAYTSVAVGLIHRWQPEEWRTPIEVSLLAGRGWYAQEEYSRYTRAGVAKPFALGKSTVVRLDAGAEGFERLTDGATSRTYSANAVMLHEFESDANLRLSLGYYDTISDDGALARRRVAGGVGYTLAKPVAGARVTLLADFERAVYDDFPQREFVIFPFYSIETTEKRVDVSGEVGLRLWFEDLDYYGFSPTVTIAYGQTHSTLDLYDTVEAGVKLGFVSSF